MSVFISILTMLIMLSILTIVHEWGHFIAARIFKVKVTEFSIFMGPAIWSRTSKKTGTKFSIRALPIGGYCAFEDDNGNADSPDSLNSQKWYKRLVIFVAGVFLNIVLALILAIIILSFSGYQTTEIDSVSQNTPAVMAGLEAGDELKEINGHSVLTTTDYQLYAYAIEDENDSEEIMDSHYTLTYEKQNGVEVLWDIKKHAEYTIEKNDEGEITAYNLLSYRYTIVTDDGKDTAEYIYECEVLDIVDETYAVCNVTRTAD